MRIFLQKTQKCARSLVEMERQMEKDRCAYRNADMLCLTVSHTEHGTQNTAGMSESNSAGILLCLSSTVGPK